MKARIIAALFIAVTSSVVFAQEKPKMPPLGPQQTAAVDSKKPELPKEATAQPIPVDPQTVQVIGAYLQRVEGLRAAMQLIQKEIDSNTADANRAFAAAQAVHPDMPIDQQTWTYKPKVIK